MENKSAGRGVQRVALACAILASFIAPFMSSSINIALPSIGKEFSLNARLMNWVPSSYLLAAAMFLVPFGRLADIVGRKKIFAIGMGLLTATSLACALAPSVSVLILFAVILGIGSAMVFSTALAILSSVFPPGERGRAIGIAAASTYLGLSLGPVLGGLITQRLGWRSIFLVNVPLGLIALILLVCKLKGEWAGSRGERFDVAGSVLLGLSLPAVMLGFSRLPAPAGVGFLAGGVAGLALFVLWESRAKAPVLNIKLFRRNALFAFSNLAALINYSATFAVGFLLSLYLQYVKALSPQQAGLLLVAQPAVMATLSPLAGRLSDRIESWILASAGMACAVAGLALLAFLSRRTSLGYVAASLVILGFGFALFSSPNTNAVMSAVEKQFYGVASATLASMRLIGQMLSMGIALLIFTLFLGTAKITPQVHALFLAGTRTAFLIFASLCFGGVFASLARGKRR